jgi:Protein kinase domain
VDTTVLPLPGEEELARRLPRYQGWKRLSHTAMSAVYLATDTKRSNRQVAVKVLLPQLAGIAAFRERFLREARTMESLDHHNIIDIVGRTEAGEDLLYLAMPYIEGSDLHTLLENEGRLAPSRMLHIVRQVARALDYTHQRGVVHRDVKPANILLAGEDEHVYLCDFGIALVMGDDRLTQLGLPSPGTPYYMAPERRTGGGAGSDPREDVYSLGAVVRRCLTGGRSAAVLPREVDRVVRKAMDSTPADRYAACGELVADLRQALDAPHLPRALAAVGEGVRTIGEGVRAIGRAARTALGALNLPRPVLIAAGVAVLLAGVAVVLPPLLHHGPTHGQLARVPAGFRTNCRTADPATGFTGASAVLSCAHGGQNAVFSLFDRSAALDDAYAGAIHRSGIARGSGDCTVTVGAEHRYPGAGRERGRVLCYQRDGRTDFVWTDNAERTIARAGRAEEAGGPDLAPAWASWVGLPGFPTTAEKSLMDLVSLPDCHRTPAGDFDAYQDVLAAIDCASPGDGANSVTYYRFGDPAALTGAQTADATRVKAPAGVDCGDGTAPGGLGEHVLDLRSVVIGDLLCYPDAHKSPVFEWTEKPLLIMGRATGTDRSALATWWRGYFGYAAPTPQLAAAADRQATPVFPDAQEQALLKHIPASSRVNCMRPPHEQIVQNVGNAPVTAVVCGPTRGASIVFYYQFDDAATMKAAYAMNNDISGPDCTARPADFHGDAPYSKAGATGRLGCATINGNRSLNWTNSRLEILTLAYGGGDQLLDWWRFDAGPV